MRNQEVGSRGRGWGLQGEPCWKVTRFEGRNDPEGSPAFFHVSSFAICEPPANGKSRHVEPARNGESQVLAW